MSIKVLLADKFSSEINELIKLGDFEITEKTGMNFEELAMMLPGFDCVLIRSATSLPGDLLEKAGGKLKLIGRGGVGVDNIDIPAASKMGIKVMNTPMANAESTAENAVALMFSAARQIPFGTAKLKAGEWAKKQMKGRQLGGQTLGLIGTGNIGRIVAGKCYGVGMDVVAYDPFVTPDADGNITVNSGRFTFKVKMVKELDELLKAADFVSIHVPLTKTTKNLINADRFKTMKNSAIIVNNSRGGVVNEDDLYTALKDGEIAAAGLDVFGSEPCTGSPLFELDNFIATPHISATTYEAQLQVAIDLVNQIKAFFVDKKELCILN